MTSVIKESTVPCSFLTSFVTIGPAKSNGLMVVFFTYKLIGVTSHNSFKRHYTLAYMIGGQCLYYDGQLKPPHTQPLTVEIIQGSVTQHILIVVQNKQQSTAMLHDKLESF